MPPVPDSAYFLQVPPGVLSAADAEAATYQLTAYTSAGSAERTDEHQAALFDILHRVANSTVDAGGGMAQRVVETLSFVVGDEANQATMAQAGAVLDQLVLSQASSLAAAGSHAQSIVTISANIQMMVAVTPPGDSQLTTQPLTVPGCPSSFEPMPANLLPTDVGIITSFFALAFDPHAGTSGVNTTGVTRACPRNAYRSLLACADASAISILPPPGLAFSYTDGTPLEVGNATTPIRFTLPGVDTSGGEQASCSFWDTDAEAYSTEGCVGLPAPYPVGHNVTWLDNFTAHSNADLVLSWELTGPMVDDGSCYAAVLDCTSEQPGPYFVDPRTRELQLAIHPATVYPDPWQPLIESAITCGNGSTGPLRTLRVYYGHDCQLWQPDNEYNCSWNNVKQAFEGGGCVSQGPTRCMCRHLTDFASARVPKIATCSLSDMTSLNPNDLITKLKLCVPALWISQLACMLTRAPYCLRCCSLFQLVVILFGVMNVGAIVGVWMDMSQRKSALAAFQRPEMGFTEHPGGELWTWCCTQEPLDRAVGAPAGTAVQLAHALGVPFARLRAAVPEALVAGTVGHALGRRVGLSVTGLEAAHEENMAAMTSLRNSFSCFGGGGREKIPEFDADPMMNAQAQKSGAPERIPAFSDSAERQALAPVKTGRSRGAGMLKATEASAAPAEPGSSGGRDEVAEEMVGTALVLAFMSNAKTLKVTEQARRVAAASAHFRGVTVRGIDHDWDWLYSCYLLMLNPGNLSSRSGWLEKSRLWRFLMMQRTDGSWDADMSIAFALQSHDARPDAPPPPKTQNRFLLLLGSLLGGDEDVEEMFEDAEEDKEAEARAARRSSVQPPPSVTAGGEPLPSDCPLTFSHAAIIAAMPPLLATLNYGFYRRQAEQARQAEMLAQQEAELEAARRAAAGSMPTSPTGTEMDAAGFGVSARLAALLQVGTAQSLRTLLDGAVESLQRELGAMQRQVSAAQRAGEVAPQRMRRTEEMRRLQRATSRRLERMVSLRMALPPDQPPQPEPEPEPATPAATESGASRRPGPRGRDKRGPVPIERIWATVLSVETLRDLRCCWLVDDEAEVARTIVDAGYDFLHAQARADPRVRRMLKSGTLFSAARRARREWAALQRSAVGQLRDADIINKFTALTHVQRASARIVRSMCTDHTTFATFLDVDGYIMRWQRFMIVRAPILAARLCVLTFASAADDAGVQHAAGLHLVLLCAPCAALAALSGLTLSTPQTRAAPRAAQRSAPFWSVTRSARAAASRATAGTSRRSSRTCRARTCTRTGRTTSPRRTCISTSTPATPSPTTRTSPTNSSSG